MNTAPSRPQTANPALRRSIRATIAGCAAAATASAYAQSVPTGTDGEAPSSAQAAPLEEIVVKGQRVKLIEQTSATKMPLSIRETPQSISIITRDSLEARQSRDINSALELVAGTVPQGQAFAGNMTRRAEDFVLRGQTLNGGRDVRIDGYAAGADRSKIDMAPFDHIEVVKGPASMLYGQGSLGGFVNLVRKKPKEQAHVAVSAQAGSFDTYRTEAELTGPLTGTGNTLGLVTLAYENSKSFIDNVYNERMVVAPSISTQLGERTKVHFDAIYQDDDFDPGLGIPLLIDRDTGIMTPPNIPRSFYFGARNSQASSSSGFHAALQFDHELNDRWLATLALQRNKTKLLGLADGYGYGIYEGGYTPLYSSYVAHDNETWAGELRVQGKFDALGREHQVLLGAERNAGDFLAWGGGGYPSVGYGNIYTQTWVGSFPASQLERNFDARSEITNTGFYGQLHFSVLDRTKVLLGSRFDKATQNQIRQGVSQTGDDAEDEETTFRFGITQELGQNVTAYGSIAQSFNPVQSFSRAGTVLDPETGEGYEVGLKSEWLDKRFGVTLAAFRQELDNRPIPDPENTPSEFFFISGGLQRTDGLELELAGEPFPGLAIQGAATWLDSEYIDSRDPNFGLAPGGTVEKMYSAYVDYAIQGGPLRGFGIGGTVISVGDRFVLSGGQNLLVDGYERLDLHMSYDSGRTWKIALQVRNVTDEKYIERINSAFAYAHFFGAPTAAMLRFDYRIDP
jgi:iron complex outermembrane receptor protein